jgi:hypothetical protein
VVLFDVMLLGTAGDGGGEAVGKAIGVIAVKGRYDDPRELIWWSDTRGRLCTCGDFD